MRIKKIQIKNYRSIINQTMDFDAINGSQCSILLGINEYGKSNILKGMSLKDHDHNLNYQTDCNRKSTEEDPKIKVIYFLEVEKSDLISFKEELKKLNVPESLIGFISIQDIIQRQFTFDSDGERNHLYRLYLQAIPKIQMEKYVFHEDSIQIKSENHVRTEDYETKNILTREKLEIYIEEKLFNFFDSKFPKIIFWKSESEYLINDLINLEEFKDDHNISIPLKNCFLISGISKNDIKSKIDSIDDDPSRKLELEEKLSNGITSHINRIWPEHKISIKISINNKQLSFLVEDKDNRLLKYEVDQRSDGFRQFISILLNLSIESNKNILKNALILIDEPETHLHPSGQSYLLQELLKISQNNVVVFATHSVFLIDKQNIDRHFSVEKIENITRIAQIEKDNLCKEEVLYRSLGTSIFEHINPNVLIFEGTTDKYIFDLYSKEFKEEFDIPDITTISSNGANTMTHLIKFCVNGLVKFFAILDSDQAGTNSKKKIEENIDFCSRNKVFEINDILSHKTDIKNIRDYALEDLFSKEHFEKAIKKVCSKDIPLNSEEPFSNQWNVKKSSKEASKKEFLNIISKLSKEDLKKQRYYTFFKNLINILNETEKIL